MKKSIDEAKRRVKTPTRVDPSTMPVHTSDLDTFMVAIPRPEHPGRQVVLVETLGAWCWGIVYRRDAESGLLLSSFEVFRRLDGAPVETVVWFPIETSWVHSYVWHLLEEASRLARAWRRSRGLSHERLVFDPMADDVVQVIKDIIEVLIEMNAIDGAQLYSFGPEDKLDKVMTQ